MFDILLELVRHSGRVVEKRELMATVWPDSFVEDSNLTQPISTLRKKLSQRAGTERYILTVPGRGYRFIATVRGWDDDALVTVHERVRSRVIVEDETESGYETSSTIGIRLDDTLTHEQPRAAGKAQAVLAPVSVIRAPGTHRKWLLSLGVLAVIVVVVFLAWGLAGWSGGRSMLSLRMRSSQNLPPTARQKLPLSRRTVNRSPMS